MTILPKIERIAPADLSAEEFFAYVAVSPPHPTKITAQFSS
jgi:hypothetical protein